MNIRDNGAHFPNKRKQGRFKRLIALLTLVTFMVQPLLAAAGGPVADPNAGANKPRIDTTANGLPLVQITNPSAAGVSHNKYLQYNVDPKGVILNNSLSITLTQQGGYVAGNPFLTRAPARIILNEVTGPDLSLLRGYTEVAGQKADVVIANPNGITCSGCGFINASRGVLTTGTPVFGGSGSLDAFRVTGGNITVEGTGMNARGADQVDLISRTVNINAGLWADYLNVITGSNRVNYADLTTQSITPDDPTPPTVSIDVAALGGMYANKIRLVGTEAGVGVVNNGTIASAGDFTLTSAGQITNNSRIFADQLSINATSLVNDGPDAVIATRNENGAADFLIRDNLTNSNGAWIYSMGDMVIAGSRNADGTYTNTGNILNQSATIEAGRDLTIFAGNITNQKQVFVTEEQQLTPTVHVTGEPTTAPPGGWDASLTYDQVVQDTVVVQDSAPGQILASNNMTLTANNIDSRYSTIAAGNDLTIDVTGQLNNLGRGGFEVTTKNGAMTWMYMEQYSICHHYGPVTICSYDNYRPAQASAAYNPPATQTIISLPEGGANISAGGQLLVNAGAINNVTLGPGNTFGTTLTSGTSIVSGTPTQPNFNPSAPGGLYNTNTNPGSHYLVETNPLFTDLRTFMSSDYMLARLAYDPEMTQKRLGDGFYEQKLVLDEITKATGRRFLDNYASAEDQYKALMDEGVMYAKEFKLTIGVGLTATQMAQLTSDMVWLVEKEVQGQKVLAPVVYLSRLHSKDLTMSGALIAARDITLKSASDLTNSGTIKAGYRNQIFASNITNLGGVIDSGNSSELTASKDITNRNGTISGGSVALFAGRDIKNETATETVTHTYAEGTASNTRVGRQAAIESRGELTATAGRDIVISGGKVTAAGDATLEAGRNLKVGSVEKNDHIAVSFNGSGFYTGENTTHILSSIQTGGNLSLSAKNDASLAGAQVTTGSDLSLTAGGNVSLTAVNDRALRDARVDYGNSDYTHARTIDEKSNGTSISAGGNVTIKATGRGGEQTVAYNDRVMIDDGARIGFLPEQSIPSGPIQKVPADRGNIFIEGSSITSKAGAITLNADKNITIQEAREYHESLTETKRTSSGFLSTKTHEDRDFVSQDLVKGSAISGKDVFLQSNNDLTIQSNSVAGSNNVTLAAGGNVNITSASDIRHEEHESRESVSGLSSGMMAAVGMVTGGSLEMTQFLGMELTRNSDASRLTRTIDETVIGSDIRAGNNVTILAGKFGQETAQPSCDTPPVAPDRGIITVKGSSITSQSGAITLAAEKDIFIQEARERHDSSTDSGIKTGRFDHTKIHNNFDQVSKDLAVGSSLSGNTITLASNRDLTIQGSSVAGDGAVVLAAGGDVKITTAKETSSEKHEQYERETGFKWVGQGGKIGFFIGSERQREASDVDSVNNVGSTVGSVSGNVSITAGKDAGIIGSNVLSATGTDILAQNVSIESAYNTYHNYSVSENNKEGVAFEVGLELSVNLSSMWDSWKRSNEAKSDRLKNLYQYKSAKTGYDTYKSMTDSGGGGVGASASLAYTNSRTRNVSDTRSVSAVGSRLITDGDLNIKATGAGAGDGDIIVTGSGLQAKNIGLEAARDIVLQSAKNTYDNTTEMNSNAFDLGIKVEVKKGKGDTKKGGSDQGGGSDQSAGSKDEKKKDDSGFGISIYADISGASGDTDAHDIAHINSTITAQENLFIKSGRDATLKGAQASANKIIADIAGNLNLESEQDKSTYRGRNYAIGGNISVSYGSGWGLGANYSQGRTDSDYHSVNGQTGLLAGSGGFDINVGKNTDLKGAVIASKAEASKNKLSTDTLTWSNIENKADYDASSFGAAVSISYSDSGKTSYGGSPMIGLPTSGKDGNITLAAISPATIEVRSDKNKDLTTLSRDTDNAHKALNKIFDQQKVAEQQEFSRVFGQEANKLVGDISKKAEWKDGSTEKMILHAIVGAVQANLGGGNALAGGLSGLTSEAVIPIMEQVLQNNGIQKGTSEYNSLMQLASTVIGGAAGAIVSGGNTEGIGSGAATALSNIQNNYLKHQEIKEKVKLDEQCARGNQQACADAKKLQDLSDDRDKELKESCGWNGDPAKCGQLQQDVRYAYAEIIRKGSDGLNAFAFQHYAGETEYQADTTLSKSDRLKGNASGIANSFIEGFVGIGKGLGTVTAALTGNEYAQKDTGDFFRQLANDPGRVADAMLNATPEQREKLAQAYERGDAYEIGKVGGEVLANVSPVIGGGAGIIGKVGKVGKIEQAVDKVGDAARAVKTAEKLEEVAVETKAGRAVEGNMLNLRAQYEADVKQLGDLALNARAAGMDVEATARMVHAERNALKVQYRELSPSDNVFEFEQRNIEKYGNPIGPTIEQLRAQGKTWEQIIESASRPGGADLGF